jgi:tRNA threonylcarbamoyladenosine biosynthesis protein TsaB
MLNETAVSVEDLEAIAVCIGPGSYTGVRIGVAVAKGLAIVHKLPMVGCNTLDIVVAAQPPDSRPLCAFFIAGRRRVGYARFRWIESAWRAETDVRLVTWSEFVEDVEEPSLVVGEINAEGVEALEAIRNLVELPQPAWRLRRAGFLADLAWERLYKGRASDPVHVNPIYVR